MSEFLQGLAYLSATIVGAGGVSFGLYAGIQAATWAFGPLRVNTTQTVHHKYEPADPL